MRITLLVVSCDGGTKAAAGLKTPWTTKSLLVGRTLEGCSMGFMAHRPFGICFIPCRSSQYLLVKIGESEREFFFPV